MSYIISETHKTVGTRCTFCPLIRLLMSHEVVLLTQCIQPGLFLPVCIVNNCIWVLDFCVESKFTHKLRCFDMWAVVGGGHKLQWTVFRATVMLMIAFFFFVSSSLHFDRSHLGFLEPELTITLPASLVSRVCTVYIVNIEVMRNSLYINY